MKHELAKCPECGAVMIVVTLRCGKQFTVPSCGDAYERMIEDNMAEVTVNGEDYQD